VEVKIRRGKFHVIFTALHTMQGGISMRNMSVRLSVRPSIRLSTRVF